MTRVVAGIDIGGTNTKISLVDESGNVISKTVLATLNYPEAKIFAEAAVEEIDKLLLGARINGRVAGVGIGAPNGNYFKGTIEFAPNLKWKGVIPMTKLFEDSLHAPTIITNDAKAAALGEMYFGAARELTDFIYITLGTGLGSGFVVNRKLVYGHDGFAGEFGHTIMIPHGRLCGCGRRGCLEQYCSATGIVKTYLELIKNSDAEGYNNLEISKIDSAHIYERALSGDEDAFYAFNYTGEMLGLALANAVVVTSPQAIFLFGGVAAAGELIFNPTIMSFEKNLMPIYRNKVKILPSGLPENDCAILGAASLIWDQLSN